MSAARTCPHILWYMSKVFWKFIKIILPEFGGKDKRKKQKQSGNSRNGKDHDRAESCLYTDCGLTEGISGGCVSDGISNEKGKGAVGK